MVELLLDSQIRFWVFLPIVILTFLIGALRHYLAVLLSSDSKVDFQQLQDSHALKRANLLQENGSYLPYQSFQMRRHYFNNKNDGYLTSHRSSIPNQNPMTDTRYMKDALKGQATNVLPMLLIGGWINVVFSGFVTSKIPFPITLQFKEMLQRGIELHSLDASWVSSASWYFLNVFGLRSIYDLVFSEHEDYFTDCQEYATNGLSTTPNEIKFIFKAEWESLEIIEHKWALKNIEKEILAEVCFM